MKFELGPGMKCDLDMLIERRMFIQASSGGGKSRTLRRICEQTHGKIPQIIIDPEGELVTLREKFDYVLAAGAGGDTQAHPRTAGLLAEKLLELGVSAIIDLYELKRQQQQDFIKAFFTALMEIPKRLWTPRLIIVDEAQLFAPEGVKCDTTAEVIDVATRGRKRGHVLIAATQRIGMFDKNVAAVLHNKLIGFTSLDTDLKRAAFELGFDKEKMLGLRELEPMHFWGFGPALTRTPTLVEIGPHVTSHPKHGQKVTAVTPPPTEKIKALLPQLADLPVEAEQRAKSIDDLKRDNAELRRKLATAERQVSLRVEPKAETKVERVVVPMLTEGHLGDLKAASTRLQATFADARGLVERVDEARSSLVTALHRIDVAIAQATKPVQTAARVHPAFPPLPAKKRPSPVVSSQPHFEKIESAFGDASVSLATAQRKILNALAFLEQVGYALPDKVQVSLFAGLSPTAGHTSNMFGGLRTAGMIEYLAGGKVRLTDSGRAHADAGQVPQSAEEMQQLLLGRVAAAQRKILTVLIEAYPQPLNRREASERAGLSPDAGHTNNMYGGLRTMGVIDYPTPGTVVALPVLFLEGAA
jgi:hypothetical protein